MLTKSSCARHFGAPSGCIVRMAPVSRLQRREIGAAGRPRGVTPTLAATRVCATWQTSIPEPPILLRR
jgi:hypothetical protein